MDSLRARIRQTAAPMALILVSSLALAGCGDDSDSGSVSGSQTSSATPAGDFNDADVTFATQMIPHHQQAVQMATIAARKATTPEVKKLATAIKASQGPEIKTMNGWLTSWGKPVPTVDHHGGPDLPGMMTEDEMSDLGNAEGSMVDRLWTQMMIEHHKGAVTMAKIEQTSGKSTEAIALAKKIETDQNREIATMQRLLATARP